MQKTAQQSQIKQRINKQYKEIGINIARLIKGHEPLLSGSVYVRRRRCGKPGCRCNRGGLHEDIVYAVRKAKGAHVRSVEQIDVIDIKRGINQLKRYRCRRQEMIKSFEELKKLIGKLEKLRMEEYK